LRYDGYYILADIMEIPNLRQKSTEILNRKLSEWCLGIEPQHDPFLPERKQVFFALYTVAAAVYRWFITFSILWFLYQVFKPYRLEVVGQIIAGMALYSLLFQPVYKMAKFFYVPGRIDKVKKPRMYGTLALIAAVVAFVCLVPFPFNVMCTLEIEPYQPESVYVVVPGTLEKVHVKPGEAVDAGQPLAELTSLELETMIADLAGKRDVFEAQWRNLDYLKFDQSMAHLAYGEIPQVEKSLASVQAQLDQKRRDQRKLTLVSAKAGIVMRPPEQAKRPDDDGQLPTWSGTPLKPENLGCTLTEGTLFCQVGDPQKMQATLVVDQADIEFVRPGQSVRIQLDELPGERLRGHVDSMSFDPIKATSKQLSNKSGGEVATETDESGVERPMSTSYQARVPLDDAEGILRPGLRGRAKIDAGWRTIAQRAWRYLTQTFHFRL
jgi:putative peptide zinc metalloprotease protein